MKDFLSLLTMEVSAAFEKAGYDAAYGKVGVSNRPDLCEFQCNGAMAAAKKYAKKPIDIATEVAAALNGSSVFSSVEALAPGFLNLDVSGKYVTEYVRGQLKAGRFGVEAPARKMTIVIDYGGANVAKPLHVGHLRPAVIGESIKRIARYAGHEVIGDVHLGDWGMPMGQVITELKERQPKLLYFDESFKGEYPKEAPFSIADLEEIYPAASARCKEDAEYKKRAMEATKQLQEGRRGYRALWEQILAVSVADLKKNYGRLSVDFDLWMGESDADPLIPDMIEKMKADGYAYLSDGALVVDIREEGDKKELPPCIVQKSDGSSNYETTDLATILWREREYQPDLIIYITDKRQELHFTQVFRAAKKCGIARQETKLLFLGNGTINGKDGHPFKTRDGGVPRLEYLLRDILERMHERLKESEAERGGSMSEEEEREVAEQTALAAIKYGDLSNQASKDYIFDVERFTASEGDTGPYLLYTMARISSILRKAKEGGCSAASELAEPEGEREKALLLDIAGFVRMVEEVCAEWAPHKLCAYLYRIANDMNSFYHETKILAEPNEHRKAAYLALIAAVHAVMSECIGLLGFTAPERM